MAQFISAHYVVIGGALLYFYVAAVETMPAPGDPRPWGEKLYDWVYRFFHVVSNKVVERHPNAAIPKEVKSE